MKMTAERVGQLAAACSLACLASALLIGTVLVVLMIALFGARPPDPIGPLWRSALISIAIFGAGGMLGLIVVVFASVVDIWRDR